MIELLVDLSDREFARLLAAIGRAEMRNVFSSTIVEPEPEDPLMAKLGEEYRASGGFKPAPRKPVKEPAWFSHLVRDKRAKEGEGKIMPGVVNACIAMREDPALSGLLGYDEKHRKVVLKARLPDDWSPGFFDVRVIEEPDFIGLYEYLLRQGLRLTKEEMRSAVRKVAKENPLAGE
jgi:hypothetical protein